VFCALRLLKGEEAKLEKSFAGSRGHPVRVSPSGIEHYSLAIGLGHANEFVLEFERAEGFVTLLFD
jgi:hypothetical protein